MTHNNLERLKKEYKDNSEFKAVIKSNFKKMAIFVMEK